MLVAADGNQSLKLVDSAFRAGDLRPDDRSIISRRWLSPDEVNVFKDEVRNAKKTSVSSLKKYSRSYRASLLLLG